MGLSLPSASHYPRKQILQKARSTHGTIIRLANNIYQETGARLLRLTVQRLNRPDFFGNFRVIQG
jgi:hypothetical protein